MTTHTQLCKHTKQTITVHVNKEDKRTEIIWPKPLTEDMMEDIGWSHRDMSGLPDDDLGLVDWRDPQTLWVHWPKE